MKRNKGGAKIVDGTRRGSKREEEEQKGGIES